MKDKRYLAIHNLIVTGYIKEFKEIFDTLPKSVMAADLKINNNRFSHLIKNVEEFTVKQLFAIAALLEIGFDKMWDLIIAQYQKREAIK